MERGLVMVVHSIAIGMIAYVIMVHVLGQPAGVAEDRSVLLCGLAIVYMVLFGHGSPMKGVTNKSITTIV